MSDVVGYRAEVQIHGERSHGEVFVEYDNDQMLEITIVRAWDRTDTLVLTDDEAREVAKGIVTMVGRPMPATKRTPDEVDEAQP